MPYDDKSSGVSQVPTINTIKSKLKRRASKARKKYMKSKAKEPRKNPLMLPKGTKDKKGK